MIPLQDPASYYEEDFHRHDFFTEDGTHIATIEFDDIDDEGSGKLFCEVTAYIRLGSVPDEPVVAFERANLLTKGNTSTGLKSIVTKLEGQGSINWTQGFDTAAYRSIVEHRSKASESVWMEKMVAAEGDTPYLLYPFIASSGVTVMYAPMGSNKSMFALQLAYSIASGEGLFGYKPTRTGPAMYVDFEDTIEPHNFRLSAMTDGNVDGLIRHVRVTKSLKDARRVLRRMVREDNTALVVIDSIGLARAADVSGSEATIKLFKMFNQLGASVLAIDHMTKEDNKRVWTGKMDAREATPIGSQFTQSSARLAWFMNLLPQSTAERKIFNLYNTKNNHDAQQGPIGMSLELTQGVGHQLADATFRLDGGAHDIVVVDAMKLTKAQELVIWHFTQQREDGQCIPMTTKEMEKSNINGATIRSIVTSKASHWWEQVEGSKQYILSPQGLESAMLLHSLHGGAGASDDDA